MRYIVSVLLLFSCIHLVNAQMNTYFNRVETSQVFKDVLDITVDNQSGKRELVKFELIITSFEFGKVYELRTDRILLNSGRSNVRYQDIPAIEYEFFKDKEDILFRKGIYDIQLRVIQANTYQVLSELKHQLIIKSDFNEDSSRVFQGKVNFSADINLYGSYEVLNESDSGQTFPTYYRAYIQPKIQVLDIPLGAEVMLNSDEKGRIINDGNIFRVNFDHNTFMRQQQNKHLKKVDAIYQKGNLHSDSIINKVYKEYVKEKYPVLNSLQEELADPNLDKYLKNKNQYEQYYSQLKKDGKIKEVGKFQTAIEQLGINESEFVSIYSGLKEQDLGILKKYSGNTDKLLNLAQNQLSDSLKLQFKNAEDSLLFFKSYRFVQENRSKFSYDQLQQIADMKFDNVESSYESVLRIKQLNNQLQKYECVECDKVKGKYAKWLNRKEEFELAEFLSKNGLYDSLKNTISKKNGSDTMNTQQELYRLFSDLESQGRFTGKGSNEIEYYRSKISKIQNKRWGDWLSDVDEVSKIGTKQKKYIDSSIQQYDKQSSKLKKYSKKKLDKLYKNYDAVKKYKNVDTRELLSDQKSFAKLDEHFDITSTKEKIFNSIKGLEVGTTYPFLSGITLNGSQVIGAYVSTLYKQIRVSAAVGTLHRLNDLNPQLDSVLNVDPESDRIKYDIVGLKLGRETPSSVIGINYLVYRNKRDVEDAEKSASHILSLEAKKSFWNEKMIISTEVAKKFNKHQATSMKDFAMVSSIYMDIGRNRKIADISGTFQLLGANYYSPSILFYAKNRKVLDLISNINLYKNIVLSLNHSYDSYYDEQQKEDFLYQINSVNLQYTPAKLPYITVGVNRIHNKMKYDREGSQNINYQLVLNTGYDFVRKDHRWTIQLGFNNQKNQVVNYNAINLDGFKLYFNQYDIYNFKQFNVRNIYSYHNKFDLQFNYTKLIPSKNIESDMIKDSYEVQFSQRFNTKYQTVLGVHIFSKNNYDKNVFFSIQNIFNLNKILNFNISSTLGLMPEDSETENIKWKKSLGINAFVNIKI